MIHLAIEAVQGRTIGLLGKGASRQLERALVTVCFAFCGVACGPNYVVIRQADPNPLIGQKEFSIAPIDFSKIEGVADEHVQAIQQGFDEQLREDLSKFDFSSTDGYSIQGSVTLLEGGITAGITSSDAELHMVVQIKKGDDVVDELELRAKASQDDGFKVGGVGMGNFSSSQRLESCAEEIAEDLADYLKKRTASK